MAVAVMELSTTDPEVGHAALSELYAGERPLAFSRDGVGFECVLRSASTPVLGVARISYSTSAAVSIPPPANFLAGYLIGAGRLEFKRDGHGRRFGRGDAVCSGRGVHLHSSWADLDVLAVRVPFSEIDRVARERTGAVEAVRFDVTRASSAGAARRWRAVTRFVWDESLAPDSALDNPLLEQQFAALIAATALTVFPNSMLRADLAGPRDRTPPQAIRRAMAFIEERAGNPLTITDVAAASDVTPRALQYGFARHCEMSPMAFVRRVRLERAHHELQTADPTTGTTVAQIAARWGFANPGRFAYHYRAMYGESPSQTLAR